MNLLCDIFELDGRSTAVWQLLKTAAAFLHKRTAKGTGHDHHLILTVRLTVLLQLDPDGGIEVLIRHDPDIPDPTAFLAPDGSE